MPQYDWAKITPRETVAWFAERMEETLQRNDHKGGWDNCTLAFLYERLREEVKEVHDALWRSGWDRNKATEDLIAECTDVSNFAMMIADQARQAARRAKGVDV